MEKLLIFFIGFLPGVFYLWYFYKKDKYEPEPVRLIIKTYFMGMLAAIPISFLEAPFAFSGFILIVIAAPVIEEYGKYFVVKRKIYQNVEFDEPMDGIIYAVSAALGFASIENGFYLVTAHLEGEVMEVFIMRALLSVPGHALFSSMWGYALGMTKFSDKPHSKNLIRKGLGLAMLFHAGFNFLLVSIPFASVGVFVLVPVMWKVVHNRIKTALSISPYKDSS